MNRAASSTRHFREPSLGCQEKVSKRVNRATGKGGRQATARRRQATVRNGKHYHKRPRKQATTTVGCRKDKRPRQKAKHKCKRPRLSKLDMPCPLISYFFLLRNETGIGSLCVLVFCGTERSRRVCVSAVLAYMTSASVNDDFCMCVAVWFDPGWPKPLSKKNMAKSLWAMSP